MISLAYTLSLNNKKVLLIDTNFKNNTLTNMLSAKPSLEKHFNQSLVKLLAPGNVEMIGAVERVGSSEGQGASSAMLPALKVKEFTFTSQSEAV